MTYIPAGLCKVAGVAVEMERDKPEPYVKTRYSRVPTADIPIHIAGLDARIAGLERMKHLANLELKRRKRNAAY